MPRADEFELIHAFCAALPHPHAPFGPGDDAATVPRPRSRLCVTTDAVVEGVHFRRPFFSLADIGHKALAVNLSDLAAMGAKPTWWLCALGLPKAFRRRDVVALARGMAPLARRYRLSLVGGNVTSSPVLTVTLTVAGEAKRPLLRSGGRPGDLLFVSGLLGAAAAGLTRPIAAQKRPRPQLELGLAASGWASAAIDLSDGLLADLGHLCEASRVGAELDGASLPIHPAATRDQALNGGEDYQLLLAVPPRLAHRARGLTRIGVLTRRRELRVDGALCRPKGFDHFRR